MPDVTTRLFAVYCGFPQPPHFFCSFFSAAEGGAFSEPMTTPSVRNSPVDRIDVSESELVTHDSTNLANNVALVVIGSGPVSTNSRINAPFVSVTLCHPGTSTCQTIDHVLVDTGSYGLRIIAPNVLDPALALPAVTGSTGNQMGECAQLFNGFLWGSVRLADVRIAGETAHSLPIQIVSDTSVRFKDIPSGCSNRGENSGTVPALGANGILGIGLFKHDCGTACAEQVIPGAYYECSVSSCKGSRMPLVKQVSNPVAAFVKNNNGVVIVMPAVAAGGVKILTGALIFGIDTQANNKVGAATVYAANSSGNFSTTYNGKSLTSSFLDTGSNGMFFFDSTITKCSVSTSFYCPATTLSLSAVNTSANGVASGRVNFTVENLQTLGSTVRAASVGGNIDHALHNKTFDWLFVKNMQKLDGAVREAFVRSSIGRPQYDKDLVWPDGEIHQALDHTVEAVSSKISVGHNLHSRAFVWGMPFFFGRSVFFAIDGADTLKGPGPYWAY